jgi:hypothetical protein
VLNFQLLLIRNRESRLTPNPSPEERGARPVVLDEGTAKVNRIQHVHLKTHSQLLHPSPPKSIYPAKVILAWAEAISGNREIRDWLMQNGYPELAVFVFALHNQPEPRQWLMDNGFPHLMALINGAEGKPNAILWLRNNGYDILEKMARAADNNEDALLWLFENGYHDMATVAQRMRKVKNDIEENNSDVHRISGV